MVKHKIIYMNFFDLTPDMLVPCERCWRERAVDVHHCEERGIGGDPTGSKDYIENLGGVCRKCHDILGSNQEENEEFKLWCQSLDARLQKMRRALYGG